MKRVPPTILLVAALAASVGLSRCGNAGRAGVPAAPGKARVERVVDGDTVVVRMPDGSRERVRYIGIDTPESVKPDTPVQCFAKAASKANDKLVYGRQVRLVYDAERRDRYGRLLAYLYRDDGLFVNAELVRRGYARTLTIPPNVAHADQFSALARRAQRKGTGLWGEC